MDHPLIMTDPDSPYAAPAADLRLPDDPAPHPDEPAPPSLSPAILAHFASTRKWMLAAGVLTAVTVATETGKLLPLILGSAYALPGGIRLALAAWPLLALFRATRLFRTAALTGTDAACVRALGAHRRFWLCQSIAVLTVMIAPRLALRILRLFTS